jgi:hypothetical protein
MERTVWLCPWQHVRQVLRSALPSDGWLDIERVGSRHWLAGTGRTAAAGASEPPWGPMRRRWSFAGPHRRGPLRPVRTGSRPASQCMRSGHRANVADVRIPREKRSMARGGYANHRTSRRSHHRPHRAMASLSEELGRGGDAIPPRLLRGSRPRIERHCGEPRWLLQAGSDRPGRSDRQPRGRSQRCGEPWCDEVNGAVHSEIAAVPAEPPTAVWALSWLDPRSSRCGHQSTL